MINKTIHYCWFGGNKKPAIVKKCIKSWKKFCPDYEIIEWNENNFDINCNKFVKDAYKKKAWAFVSDYARLKVIYEYGGIYLDTDVELIKKIDDLLINDFYIGIQQSGNYATTGLGFGAIKKNEIVKEMLEIYDKIEFDYENLNSIICPILNSKVLKNNNFTLELDIEKNGNATIYSPKYFDPISPGNTENLLCNDTYSIHHYSATWTNTYSQLKRRIFNYIGQEKINKIKKKLKEK